MIYRRPGAALVGSVRRGFDSGKIHGKMRKPERANVQAFYHTNQ
jgi:hypothetical protein